MVLGQWSIKALGIPICTGALKHLGGGDIDVVVARVIEVEPIHGIEGAAHRAVGVVTKPPVQESGCPWVTGQLVGHRQPLVHPREKVNA